VKRSIPFWGNPVPIVVAPPPFCDDQGFLETVPIVPSGGRPMGIDMCKADREQLTQIMRLLEQALVLLDQKGLDLAAAHLDRCRDEVQRSLNSLRSGGC
jgi:hypothetical protein